MRTVALALALGLLLALSCRKDDGTTPNPNGPVQPSATASDPITVPPPTATASTK